MTAHLPAEVRRRILTEAAATDGSDRALDKIAAHHGLMLEELRGLLAARPLAPRRTAAPTPLAETHRTCSICETEKPINDFYRQERGRGGRMSHCIACNNKRPPTETRMVRNRARTRALALLARAHADEFAGLYNQQLVQATREHAQLQQAADGRPDAAVARLRPGPVREGETKLDRLDIARCQQCQTHHDADHECPNCGDATPDTAPTVKPWVVRAWALEQGLAPVPTRGPIPDRILAAYAEANADLQKAGNQ